MVLSFLKVISQVNQSLTSEFLPKYQFTGLITLVCLEP